MAKEMNRLHKLYLDVVVPAIMKEKGYTIGNIDSTVAAQAPKLNPYIPAMQRTMADVLGIDVDCVSVKATTTEKLGFEGRKEGITAYATVLISK